MSTDKNKSLSEIHQTLKIKLFKDDRPLVDWEEQCQNREISTLVALLQDLKQSVNTYLSDLVVSEKDTIYDNKNTKLCESEDLDDDEDALWQVIRTVQGEPAAKSCESGIHSIPEKRVKRVKE